MAQARMAFYYDKHRRPVELSGKVYIRLTRKVGDTGYTLPCLTSLSPVKMGPFPIIKKVHDLAYHIDVPTSLGIHPVISVVHLEQAPEDNWNQQVRVMDCELKEAKYPFEVEEILDKKFKNISQQDKRKVWQYRMKWINQSDSWEPANVITVISSDKTSKFKAQANEYKPEDKQDMDTTMSRIKKNREELKKLKPKKRLQQRDD